jgi:hypothetical protein
MGVKNAGKYSIDNLCLLFVFCYIYNLKTDMVLYMITNRIIYHKNDRYIDAL